ncbi:MAG: hypothetical protein RL385_2275 [Pseudomonadota bacterium]
MSRMYESALSLALTLGASAWCAACGSDDTDGSPEAIVDAGNDSGSEAALPFTLDFKLKAGDADVDCSGPVTVGGHEVTVSVARFYVSEITLLTADGESVPVELDSPAGSATEPAYQGEGVALLDFDNGKGTCSGSTAGTNATITGKVKAGDYTGVAFSLGVPEALNHLDIIKAKAPLNVSGLYWTWLTGYMFTEFNLKTTESFAAVGPDGEALSPRPAQFPIHLGSGSCDGDFRKGEPITCKNPNRANVRLDAFDAARDAVVLDLDALVGTTDLTVAHGENNGCMAGPDDLDCAEIFKSIGLDLSTGKPSSGEQRAFRVEPK